MARRALATVLLVPALAAAAASCERQSSTRAPSADPPAARPQLETADTSIVATVDGLSITVGDVRAKLGDAQVSPGRIAAVVVGTVTDRLVLRELASLDIHPAPGESKSAAVTRLLAQVYAPRRYCGALGERDLKMAYMTQLARFKHPASWTLWSALTDQRATAVQLAAVLKERLPSPPALPAGATCLIDDSPVMQTHARPFEVVVAAFNAKRSNSVPLSAAATAVQLRRYSFYDQDDPQIPRGHFRATDPAVARAVASLSIGEIVGPIQGADGYHVALVVCREHRRFDGREAPAVKRVLIDQLCSGAANAARSDYLKRLLAGATIVWHRDVIAAAFGPQSTTKLPPDSRSRRKPTLPH